MQALSSLLTLLLIVATFSVMVDCAQAQPISGDNITLDAIDNFARFRDPGGPATDFYEINPDETWWNFDTQRTRADATMQPPMRIPWNAQPGLMHVGFSGVAIGSNPPGSFADAPLHIHSYGPDVDNSLPTAKILVEDANPASGVRTLIEMQNRGGSRFAFTNTDTSRSWAFQNNASDGFLINLLGSGGNEFSIRKTGMVTMGPGGLKNFILDPAGNLTILGTFNPASDRNLKSHFESVDEQLILNKLSDLPISTWRYKKDPADVRHIGPVAQDFYAAFAMGQSNKSISVTDASGVALAAIKALNSKCNRLQTQLDARDQKIEELESRMVELVERLDEMQSSMAQPRQ